MIKLSGSSYSLIVVLVVMLAVIGLSLKLEYFASKFLPLLIGSVIFVLALIALVGEIKAGVSIEVTTSSSETDVEEKTSYDDRKYSPMAAWIAGFFLSIYLVGFIIAAPLFVGAYMKRHGSKWLSTVITTGIFTGIFYTVFNLALKADLYKGQLLKWIGF
jgi:hypothetical protein